MGGEYVLWELMVPSRWIRKIGTGVTTWQKSSQALVENCATSFEIEFKLGRTKRGPHLPHSQSRSFPQIPIALNSIKRGYLMPFIEDRLKEMGLILPEPPEPAGNYLPAKRSGKILWLAGVGSRMADGSRICGKLGADLTVEQGYEAARWCALNLLARMKQELSELDRVAGIIKVVGFINSAPDFEGQAQVLDGASDLFVQLFGEHGRHSRSAPGMAALPGNIAVIVECVVEMEEPDR